MLGASLATGAELPVRRHSDAALVTPADPDFDRMISGDLRIPTQDGEEGGGDSRARRPSCSSPCGGACVTRAASGMSPQGSARQAASRSASSRMPDPTESRLGRIPPRRERGTHDIEVNRARALRQLLLAEPDS